MKSVTSIVVPILVVMMVVDLAMSSPSGLKNHFLGSSLAVPPANKQASRELEMANALLQRLLDVAYETARDWGVQEHELKEVQRKRNIIQACYFQAITCY